MDDEEADVILSHFLMCLNFSLIGMSREEIWGVLNISYVLLGTRTLEVVDSTVQYMQVVWLWIAKDQLNWAAMCEEGEVSAVQVYV